MPNLQKRKFHSGYTAERLPNDQSVVVAKGEFDRGSEQFVQYSIIRGVLSESEALDVAGYGFYDGGRTSMSAAATCASSSTRHWL